MTKLKNWINWCSEIEIGGLSLSMVKQPGLAQTLMKATIGSIIVRLTGMIITFFVGIILARYLGVEQYGIYGTVMSIMAILAVPTLFALPQLATKEISISFGKGSFDQILTIIYWFSLIVSIGVLVAIFIGYFGYTLWPNSQNLEISSAYFWGLGIIPVIAIGALGMGILRGLNHTVGAQLYDTMLRPAGMIILLLILIASGTSIDARSAIILQLIAGALAIFICGVYIYCVIPQSKRSSKIQKFKPSWIKTSLPMTATEILRVIDGQYPILLLGILATLSDVGIFRVAIALAAFLGLPATLLNLVVMPFVASTYEQGDISKLQKIATATAFISFCSICTIIVFIYFFGETVILILFGADYKDTWLLLMLICVAYLINGFFGSLVTILNMCGQEKTVAFAFMIGPVIGIILTLVLFPYCNLYAVPIAMIVVELIRNIWMYYIGSKNLKLNASLLSVLK